MSATNGAIITYGQTGAGKTYSMEGPNILDCDDSKRGLLARVVDGMFEQINSGDEIKYTIKLSMVEIYMEKVRDLFDLSKDNIQIKETKSQGILLPEVTEIILSDSSKALQSLSSGICNRAVGETQMNVSSSRSHCIYIFSVHQEFNKQNRAKIGKLVLVDLAGSEKVEKTGAEGKVLEEAKTINKSLSALGNVVYALTCNSNGKANHIPYRNSKLTRILQDSLGGNSQMALLCCCSPSPSNASETLSTLRFGARAKHIKASPRVHYTEDKHAKMLGTSSTSEDESSDQIIDKSGETSDDEEAKLLEELSTWWGREFDPDGFDDLEFNLVEIAAPAVPLQQAVEELASAVELLKRANEIFEFKLAYAARIFSAHNEGAVVSLTHWILESLASFSVWFASLPLVMLLAYWFRQ